MPVLGVYGVWGVWGQNFFSGLSFNRSRLPPPPSNHQSRLLWRQDISCGISSRIARIVHQFDNITNLGISCVGLFVSDEFD